MLRHSSTPWPSLTAIDAARRRRLPDGAHVPALGLGTWQMGERHATRARARSRRSTLGLDLGMTLIDTAEMYGDGGAEEIVGDAIARPARRGLRRQQGVSAQRGREERRSPRASAACAAAHRSPRSVSAALARHAFRSPKPSTRSSGCARDGKIVRWGVSNFDVADMEELSRCPTARSCATNQVLYHLGERGIEWRAAAVDAASGACRSWRIRRSGRARCCAIASSAAIAAGAGVTPAQARARVAAARARRDRDPASRRTLAHVRANRAAADVVLDAATLAALDAAFPPPTQRHAAGGHLASDSASSPAGSRRPALRVPSSSASAAISKTLRASSSLGDAPTNGRSALGTVAARVVCVRRTPKPEPRQETHRELHALRLSGSCTRRRARARIEAAYAPLLERFQYGTTDAGQDLSGLVRMIHAAYEVLSNPEQARGLRREAGAGSRRWRTPSSRRCSTTQPSCAAPRAGRSRTARRALRAARGLIPTIPTVCGRRE